MAPKSATKKPAATKTPAEGQTASKTPKAAKTPKVGADGKPAKAKRHAQKLPAPSLRARSLFLFPTLLCLSNRNGYVY